MIRGSAVNQDGASSGLTVPNAAAQERLIAAALAQAGVQPAEVAYLEAHGTGTALGDPIEAQAAARVLCADRRPDCPLLLGSVKANIGHLEAAAGIAGLIKVVLALQAGALPAQVHFGDPNPHIPWQDLAVAVVRQRRPWPAGRRIAGVSSFGFTGTNAHVVLEGYVEPPAPASAAPDLVPRTEVLVVSAKSAGALTELAGRYRAWLAAEPDRLARCDLRHGGGAQPFPASCGGGGGDPRRACRRAGSAAGGGRACRPAHRPSARAGARFAVLFGGQGSQFAGMARGLYATEPVFRMVVERCCAAWIGWAPTRSRWRR